MDKHPLRRSLPGLFLAALFLLIPEGVLAQGSAEAAFTRQDARATFDRYCVRCHNEDYEVGQRTGVMWEKVDLSDIDTHRETLERGVRKLRAGMMPPPGQVRPDLETYQAFRDFLESELDRTARLVLPPPGLHRLNRTEYGNAIRDLLALEVDANQFLPADDSSSGFDNMAGTLGMSPALLEAYLSAAAKISRLAIGNVTAPTQTVYRLPEDTTQDYHVEGLPFGTRGGTLIAHEFPADGEYEIRIVPVNMGNMGNTRPFGEVTGEQLDVMIDGARVELIDWDARTRRGAQPTVRVEVPAGLHTVGVAFLATNYAPVLDFNNKFMRSTIETGGLPGMTFYPHVGSVRIDGPFQPAGADDTASRQRIFVCRPDNFQDEPACAREILETLARRAYRRTPTPAEVDVLMEFYEIGRGQGDFDRGIQTGLQRLLAEPKFIYRTESEPEDARKGEPYRITELELASRLSFFLWSSIPDDELLDVAEAGGLSEPEVLERQVRRMLADAKADEMIRNFAGQWLALRSLETHSPVVELFPDFDDNLRQALRTETELFVGSIVRDDRPVLDLLTANHTFLNERLAKHYDIPGIYGSHFRRVELGDDLDARRGLLGKGAVLTVSSRPDRNSPVMRGKWVFQNILGVPAPAPPPGVVIPEFDKGDPTGNARVPTLREQMEMHRTVEPCKSCHQLMDPIGFSLENFDATGMWRTEDQGSPIVSRDVFHDGTDLNGVVSLRHALLNYSDTFVRTVTVKLLTYALGRSVEYYDMPVVRSIVHEAQAQDYRFSELILGVVRSEPFQMSMKVAPEDIRVTTAAIED